MVNLVFVSKIIITSMEFADNVILDPPITVMIVFATLDSLEPETCAKVVIPAAADVQVPKLVNVLLVLIFL